MKESFWDKPLGRLLAIGIGALIPGILSGVAAVVAMTLLNPLRDVKDALASMQQEHISLGSHQASIEAKDQLQDTNLVNHVYIDELRDKTLQGRIDSLSQDVRSLTTAISQLA